MFVYADNAATTKISKRGAYSDDKCFGKLLWQSVKPAQLWQQAAEQLFNARERIAKSFLMLPLQENLFYLRRK